MWRTQVVIYGASLLLAAIEAGLQGVPHFLVTRIDPQLPAADAQVRALRPHVVIVDDGRSRATFCSQHVLLVDRNANNHAALLNQQTFPIGQLTELVALIEHYVQTYPPKRCEGELN
jgi:hypothetical protein